MTSEITLTRAEFALALTEAGLDVKAYVPERVIPPVVIMNAGSPYLSPANLSNDYQLNLDLTLVANQATNETATETLDQLIQDVILAIEPLNYAVFTDVSKPFMLSANNADYLAATLTINLYINL